MVGGSYIYICSRENTLLVDNRVDSSDAEMEQTSPLRQPHSSARPSNQQRVPSATIEQHFSAAVAAAQAGSIDADMESLAPVPLATVNGMESSAPNDHHETGDTFEATLDAEAAGSLAAVATAVMQQTVPEASRPESLDAGECPAPWEFSLIFTFEFIFVILRDLFKRDLKCRGKRKKFASKLFSGGEFVNLDADPPRAKQFK